MLDWLGDLGGLFDALHILGGALVAPIAKFALEAQMMNKIFRFRASNKIKSLKAV